MQGGPRCQSKHADERRGFLCERSVTFCALYKRATEIQLVNTREVGLVD